MIAAVYLNRLRIGMLLQADPTVQYALGQHSARLFYKDLRSTRRTTRTSTPGLPPGPIASPGEPSIVAALVSGGRFRTGTSSRIPTATTSFMSTTRRMSAPSPQCDASGTLPLNRPTLPNAARALPQARARHR